MGFNRFAVSGRRFRFIVIIGSRRAGTPLVVLRHNHYIPRRQPPGPAGHLDSPAISLHNGGMELQGRVFDGVIVLEGKADLPEGAVVTVTYPAVTPGPTGPKKRIQVPLVRCKHPLPAPLTNERIGEILDEEDAAPRR
jgi:hypothetical protein